MFKEIFKHFLLCAEGCRGKTRLFNLFKPKKQTFQATRGPIYEHISNKGLKSDKGLIKWTFLAAQKKHKKACLWQAFQRKCFCHFTIPHGARITIEEFILNLNVKREVRRRKLIINVNRL